MIAGVGTPFGVSARFDSEKSFPLSTNSASSVGVRCMIPGIPAWVIPSISHVFVTQPASKKVAFLFFISVLNLSLPMKFFICFYRL